MRSGDYREGMVSADVVQQRNPQRINQGLWLHAQALGKHKGDPSNLLPIRPPTNIQYPPSI